MVEYHGWITIRDTTGDSDRTRLDEAIVSIKSYIDEIRFYNREIGVKAMNSCRMLWFCGLTNHWSSDVDEVFALLKFIAACAPGSFGILYLWNDEDPQHPNEFRIWSLARSVLSEHGDSLLSPCIPTIEDEL